MSVSGLQNLHSTAKMNQSYQTVVSKLPSIQLKVGADFLLQVRVFRKVTIIAKLKNIHMRTFR